jgi:hypothetical protein
MTKKVLAGPILRRTTKNRVCVWLATSEAMRLQLTISDTGHHPLGTGTMDVMNPEGIQLGQRLFVHLLQARSEKSSGYPFDTMMYYRVDQIRDGSTTPLFSDEERRQLAYGTHQHPSFFIPSTLKNLLHGSCRKPHGKCASADALGQGHTLMQATCGDLDNRPAILLLTGDQIYADDVAISLNATLREKAIHLTGRAERMPQIGDPRDIPLHGRRQALKENESGISSGESENHLLSFGEYAAMYLYTFGNLSAWEPVWEWDELQAIGLAREEEEKVRQALKDQNGYLRTFHNTLPDVRRLLANIPTYMIFDDHDVTDDWNITHSWYDNVRGSELGRRLVSNALAACWAFQSWGNDPDNFDKDMVWSIRQRLTDPRDDPAIEERYDLFTWKHRGWGFSVPTVPPVIAIDSRTQRQYDNYNLPAQLMDRYALDWLRVEWAKLVTDLDMPPATWPVLIAATPVLGFTPIEEFQDKILRLTAKLLQFLAKKYLFLFWLPSLGGPLDRKLVNIMDIESWAANKKGYKALFDVLQSRIKLPGCVFLSGDVHYSFSSEGDFVCDGKTFACLQLTCSALNNMPGERNQKLLEKLGDKLPKGKHGVIFAWKKRNRWSSSSTLLRPKEISTPIHAESALGLVTFSENRPVNHTLLTGIGKRTYALNRTSGDND